MECYFKSVVETRICRQRTVMLWEEEPMLKVTEERLADKVHLEE